MRLFVLLILAVVVAAALVVGILLVWRQMDRQSAMEAVQTWGRLAPLPSSATDLTVTVEGSAFTRAFRVSFRAPAADVNRWLAESPGTKGVVPERSGSTWRYVIQPGGGAQHAEVTVDDRDDSVRIYVYWS